MGTLENEKQSGSAIYFYDYGFGSVMTPAWITNLRISLKTNQTYVTIRKRDKWVNHLQKNKIQEHKEDDEVKELFEWAKHKKSASWKSRHTTPHKIKMEKKNQIITIYNINKYKSDWNHHQIKISAPWNPLDPIISTPNKKSGHSMKN
jgi:hypothetical protein